LNAWRGTSRRASKPHVTPMLVAARRLNASRVQRIGNSRKIFAEIFDLR
jgi:hypothetical protein